MQTTLCPIFTLPISFEFIANKANISYKDTNVFNLQHRIALHP